MLIGSEMQHSVVFFDGECVLCNRAANWLVSKDARRQFLIASLQGKTAQSLIPNDSNFGLQSLVLLQNGHFYTKSTAVTMILSQLTWPWPIVAKIMGLIPSLARDFIYNAIAKNRYAVFGRLDSCRVPTEREKPYFLD